MKSWSFALLLGVSANSIDWGKLTDFQTDISMKFVNGHDLSSVLGHLQFDVFGSRLRFTAIEVDRGLLPGVGPAGHKGWGEFVVDVPERKFSYRGSGTAHTPLFGGNMDFCISGEVSENLLRNIPPKAVLEKRSMQWKPRIEKMLKDTAHETKNGVMTYRNGRGAVLKIQDDGTPVEVHVPGATETDIDFSNWKAGAGAINAFNCPTGSSTELSEQTPSLAAYQILMELAQTQPANLVEMPELMMLVAHQKAKMTEPSDVSPLLTGALAAGVFGGMVVVVLAKVFGGTYRHSEPLLSDA